MKQNQLALVRRFNRAITQRIGALDDNYLSRGRSLGQSRLLWEIGPARCEVKLLRARLGLESEYFSRQLRRLEADRLLITDPDGGDGRERRVRLTRKGLAERAVLNRTSNVQDFLVEDRLISPVGDHLTGSLAEPKATILTRPSSWWQVCGL